MNQAWRERMKEETTLVRCLPAKLPFLTIRIHWTWKFY